MTNSEPMTSQEFSALSTDAEKWQAAFAAGQRQGYVQGITDSTPEKRQALGVEFKALAAYSYGETVEVWVLAEWVPGSVAEEATAGVLVVNTERGPRSIGSTRGVRPRVA